MLHFFLNLECCDAPGMTSLFQVSSPHSTVNMIDYTSWEDVWKDPVCPCVGVDENQNLSGPQKELLTWHWKLGIGMQRIQEMMRETKAVDDNGNKAILTSCDNSKVCINSMLSYSKVPFL